MRLSNENATEDGGAAAKNTAGEERDGGWGRGGDKAQSGSILDRWINKSCHSSIQLDDITSKDM